MKEMSYRILVVDDSKLARMAMVKALTAAHPDWTRIEASNADEALAHIKQTPVDVAVLDFNMPGRDGLDLAAELKAAHPAMPVAIISANHQTEVVSRTRDIGATFLSKPLTASALHAFLDLAEKQLRSAAS
jgi:DNA-binding NarL/FixJ family response regulator